MKTWRSEDEFKKDFKELIEKEKTFKECEALLVYADETTEKQKINKEALTKALEMLKEL